MRTYSPQEIVKHLKSLVTVDKKQTAVASELGLSPSFINDVMRGQRPVTERLAAALGYEKLPDRYRKIRKEGE